MPKVPLSHICAAPEKFPPRREKEATEDESGFSWIHPVELYPLGISLSMFEGKMKSPW